MKRILFIMMAVAVVGCNPYDLDEILLPREDVSFTIKGVEQFSFDPLTCQMAHNSTTHEFRVYDDKLSNWFIVKCKERPSGEGQELTADLIWTASSSTRTMKDLTFRIEKTDASGKMWMWCRQKSIGIVIKNL